MLKTSQGKGVGEKGNLYKILILRPLKSESLGLYLSIGFSKRPLSDAQI
jgi:hypothetical protein